MTLGARALALRDTSLGKTFEALNSCREPDSRRAELLQKAVRGYVAFLLESDVSVYQTIRHGTILRTAGLHEGVDEVVNAVIDELVRRMQTPALVVSLAIEGDQNGDFEYISWL